MKNTIKGKVYVLGNDIDTDQIIPAKFLSYDPTLPEEKKYFGKYALYGVPTGQKGLPEGNTPFIQNDEFSSEYKIIIAGKNFGCGSSREHAPLALNVAGAEAVIANSYARIFYRNSINGGYIIPLETASYLNSQFKTGDLAEIDLQKYTIKNLDSKHEYSLQPLGEIISILEAGDIFEYGKKLGIK